jgi:DsbC/DsbD-like thiol-disulfide interchange protein
MKRFVWRAFALLLSPCLVTLSTTTTVQAQGKKSDAVVKVKAEAGKPSADGTTPVHIHLTIDKGWHIYANPTGSEDLADAATTVTADGTAKVEGVEYPAGKVVHDKTLGDYKVYEDKATITAKVRRPPGGGAIDLSLKVQACNEQKCLVPATIKLSVR